MTSFFVYEEYGAKYESMLQIVASASKIIPSWEAYERGIEGLVNALLPQMTPGEDNKKSLTFEDLLIKVNKTLRACEFMLICALSRYKEYAAIPYFSQSYINIVQRETTLNRRLQLRRS